MKSEYSSNIQLIKKNSLLLLITFSTIISKAQWKDPSDNWRTIGPPKGTLLIIGGHASSSMYEHFMKLVGNANSLVVLIPTAGSDNDANEKNLAYKGLVDAGAKNIVIMHTRDKNTANSETFIGPLKKARGVFISGGFQNRLAQAYLHTLTHTELFNLLDRDGIIAGSSAGASIQGSYLYGGGDEKSGFGFVKNSAIGQHYVRRHRMGSVAKIIKKEQNLFGMGIDEDTAIEVQGNDFEVVGSSKVAIYDNHLPGWPRPNPQYYAFPGDKYNMAIRKIAYQVQSSPKDLWDNTYNKAWKAPSTQWTTTAPPTGKLILYGKQIDSLKAAKHFLQSIGGAMKASIVLLSSGNKEAKAENEKLVALFKKLGVKKISSIYTLDRDIANSYTTAKLLKQANAVWISEGEIWQLADVYVNTLVQNEIFELLKRNGTVGAMKAGVNLMASRLIGESYNWDRGLGLTNNTMIFAEPLTKPFQKAFDESIAKPNFIALGLENSAIIILEKNSAKVSGDGNMKFYKSNATNPETITQGQVINLK